MSDPCPNSLEEGLRALVWEPFVASLSDKERADFQQLTDDMIDLCKEEGGPKILSDILTKATFKPGAI